MTGPNGPGPQTTPVLETSGPVLSGRLAVLRSGRHLSRITENLREIEGLILGTGWQDGTALGGLNGLSRARLQSLDLLIQELAGLSEILIRMAQRLPDDPDQQIDLLVDLPRLQSLTTALRDGRRAEIPPQIELF